MNPIHRIITALALIAFCALSVAYGTKVPAPVPASASPAQFSAERAMRHVRTIARRPHPTGSTEHLVVLQYLRNEIVALGLAPEVQDVTGVGTRYAVAGRVRNLLARVPGRTPGGPAVLLVAHYDGVPAAPAAGDDAAGSAALLETLRALRAGPPLAHDVIALLTDAEEPGLLGAAAFVREHPWAKDAAVVLNFEARGTRGASFMFETGPGNLDVVRVLRTVPGVRATSLSTTVYRQLPNDTDLSEFATLERPAMNFAFIGGANRYHTAEDDSVHLSPASLQHHGNQALALARAFGNGPLPRPRTPDAVFFDVPLLGLVFYPQNWALPLALVTLGLVVAASMRIRRTERRLLRDVALGVAGTVVSVAVAGLAGVGVSLGLQRLHAALGSGVPDWSRIYVAGIAMLALALSAACYAAVRRWTSMPGTHAGALLVWALSSIFLALVAPGVSFLLTWPLLAVTVMVLVVLRRARETVMLTAIWVSTFFAMVIVVPIAYVMAGTALGLNPTGAATVAILTALLAWLLVPHLEALGGEHLWTTPLVSGGVALVLFAYSAATVRTSAGQPAGSSLAYAVDADSEGAWLSGSAANYGARAWLGVALDAAGRDTAVPAWVRRTAGARRVVQAPRATVTFAPPIATVVSDSAVAGGRRVVVRVRPGAGTRSIGMSADSGAILSAEVDGRAVATSRYRRPSQRWTLEYVAPAAAGFTLAITVPQDARRELDFIARIDGIPPLPGVQIPPRPIGVIPVQAGDVTLVYRRFRF